ncbi:MAG: 3-(methylthio)propionyl-CoA ligase [Pseudomonadota bacterium]
MQNTMQEQSPLISSLIEFAAQNHSDTEIVSRTVEGGLHRYTYRDANRRTKRLANALKHLRTKMGDRIGTLAWNGYRHYELYYAVSGMGAIVHTVNPRLFPEQLAWIINHAKDRVLFFDITFAPLIEKLVPVLPDIEAYVAMTDRAHMPKVNIPNLLCYEDLLDNEADDYMWPQFADTTPSSLCYTSGTTGDPKGVLYTHRSTIYHCYAGISPDALNISAASTVMPVVPMFHVNAWAVPYMATATGAKLVFPGAALDGASVYDLMEREKVTTSLGVPTIWMGLLAHVESKGVKFSTLKETAIGGAACPPIIIDKFSRVYGVEVVHAWGMTELSPLGTVCRLKSKHALLSYEEKFAIRVKQGRALFGIEMKIVDDTGTSLPHDGKAFGDLHVRGAWVIERYYGEEKSARIDGWFPTGDVATIDTDGYMQITDRSKDVIKSGGEWISSIELENIAMAHSAVAEAAVIGIVHPKWDERPLLLIVLKKDAKVSKQELLAFYDGKIAKWMLPNDVVFVAELPHTATGKLQKRTLRETWAAHYATQ